MQFPKKIPCRRLPGHFADAGGIFRIIRLMQDIRNDHRDRTLNGFLNMSFRFSKEHGYLERTSDGNADLTESISVAGMVGCLG